MFKVVLNMQRCRPILKRAVRSSLRTNTVFVPHNIVHGVQAATKGRRFSTESESKPPGEKDSNSESIEGAPEVDGVAVDTDPVDDSQATIAKLKDEVKALNEKVKRCYAEEENVRRIARKDVENAQTYANVKFAKALLEVPDDLERALSTIPEEKKQNTEDLHLKGLIEGIEMTDKNLVKIFKQFGITKFGEVGDPFDPQMHEALFQMPAGDQKADTIGQVVKPGYKLHDRVIRAAQVGARV